MSIKAANRTQNLFLILGSFFITNAIIAEFIGGKIFSLEKTLGLSPMGLPFLGEPRNFDMTAGVLLWPIVFIMTDVINEYFGRKGVRTFSYIAAALISYAYIAVYTSMEVPGSDFWLEKKLENGTTLDMNAAFNSVFGQGLWIIIGSLVAFLIGQLVDVWVFHRIKKSTGEKGIWLRATGSTLVSQFIDSFVVLFIAFYISKLNTPDQWTLSRVIAIGLVNYAYKFSVAIALTPVLYGVHYVIDRYLGSTLSKELRDKAMAGG